MAPTDAASHYTIIGTRGVACDLMSTGWGQEYPSNRTVMGVLIRGGDAIRAEGNVNWSYLDIAEVNAELDRLVAEPDIAKAAEGYMSLDERVMRGYAPLVPLYYDRAASLVGSTIAGAYRSTTWGFVSLQNVSVTDAAGAPSPSSPPSGPSPPSGAGWGLPLAAALAVIVAVGGSYLVWRFISRPWPVMKSSPVQPQPASPTGLQVELNLGQPQVDVRETRQRP